MAERAVSPASAEYWSDQVIRIRIRSRACLYVALHTKWLMTDKPLSIAVVDANRFRASIIEDGLR
ncbi:MAG: hypothetical protein AAFY85_10640, partial [Pseudomonadota bacterium]